MPLHQRDKPFGRVTQSSQGRKVVVSVYALNGEKHVMLAPPDDVSLMKGREVFLATDNQTVVLYPQEMENKTNTPP